VAKKTKTTETVQSKVSESPVQTQQVQGQLARKEERRQKESARKKRQKEEVEEESDPYLNLTDPNLTNETSSYKEKLKSEEPTTAIKQQGSEADDDTSKAKPKDKIKDRPLASSQQKYNMFEEDENFNNDVTALASTSQFLSPPSSDSSSIYDEATLSSSNIDTSRDRRSSTIAPFDYDQTLNVSSYKSYPSSSTSYPYLSKKANVYPSPSPSPSLSPSLPSSLPQTSILNEPQPTITTTTTTSSAKPSLLEEQTAVPKKTEKKEITKKVATANKEEKEAPANKEAKESISNKGGKNKKKGTHKKRKNLKKRKTIKKRK